MGYVFPQTASLVGISNQPQTGSWKQIDSKGSDDPITLDVFNLWVDHGAAPSDAGYAYIVVPGANESILDSYASQSPIEIQRRDGEAHVVRQLQLGLTMAVVFQAPSEPIDLDAGRTLQPESPLAFVWSEAGNQATLTVADPTQTQSQVSFVTNFPISGEGVSCSNDTCSVLIPLPEDDLAGQSKSVVVAW
jgi:hypothetical protein